jgi:ABC-type sulfate/molybdate transport systems ATPase subunit
VSELSVDLTVRAEAFTLEVAFRAPPGITVLFGPSGAGKSTTLAAIAGLVRPFKGRIALGDDVWFDEQHDTPVHKRGTAFVFQSLALFPHMTALDNVAYGIDRKQPDRTARAKKMLERMHVGHLAGRKPRTFSGGEAQRVALARAFAVRPRIVLLDEPFSAMDRDLRLSLAADVRGVADETGVPFVHVTHHRNEARALADRVVLMERGRVARIGSVDECLPPLDDSMPIDTVRRRAT